MNGNMKLLLGLGYVSGEYINTALEAIPVRARRARRHRPVRALLAAAVIVSLLLAFGAAAYAGNWFGIKDALLRQTEDTVYLSAQGLESSAEFQAYRGVYGFLRRLHGKRLLWGRRAAGAGRMDARAQPHILLLHAAAEGQDI